MSKKPSSPILLSFLVLFGVGTTWVVSPSAFAKRHKQSSFKTTSSHVSTSGSKTTHHLVSHSTHGSRHGHETVLAHGYTLSVASEHHGRHHGKHEHAVAHAAPKTRYAYSASLFMPRPPEFEQTPFGSSTAAEVAQAFEQGTADSYPARALVRAGLVHYHPLHGGIFWRREPVKYIIMHSTEPGIDQRAPRIIDSWSSMGIRHPGAQYVVDRDGEIYQAVDPELATVHINIFKTLPGINNDNSIGIEMCHTGHQDYPRPQRESVSKLVTYLQERYKVPDENVITHRYAQQGDHTDPVNFDWDGFVSDKGRLRTRAIAMRVKRINDEGRRLPDFDSSTASIPSATTFLLQPHMEIKTTTVSPAGRDENGKRIPAVKTVTTTTITAPANVAGTVVVPPAASSSAATIVIPTTSSLRVAPGFSTGKSVQVRRVIESSSSSDGPMRGPIEVEPDMVRHLSEPAVTIPSSKATPHADAHQAKPENGRTSQEVLKKDVPVETERQAERDAELMDPDGRGADAAPLPGPGTKSGAHELPTERIDVHSETSTHGHKNEQEFFIHQ